MKYKSSRHIKTVLGVLEDEVKGDVSSAMKRLDKNYTMTWVYRTRSGELFPKTASNIQHELEDVYHIRGRQYDIRNIAEGKDVVMIEMIESYPSERSGKIYRTPLVIVLEMENEKIRKGRHYCDPDLSDLHLTKRQVQKAYE